MGAGDDDSLLEQISPLGPFLAFSDSSAPFQPSVACIITEILYSCTHSIYLPAVSSLSSGLASGMFFHSAVYPPPALQTATNTEYHAESSTMKMLCVPVGGRVQVHPEGTEWCSPGLKENTFLRCPGRNVFPFKPLSL